MSLSGPRSARARRRRSALIIVALAGLPLSGVAYAGGCPDKIVAVAPPSVLIVMDASRSMAKPAGDGGSRLDAAKASLRALIDGLPDDARVGLRLYGHRVSGAGRTEGCRDTELVAPVGPLDRAALKDQIDAYHAVGSTPIGRALRAAADDLRGTGPKSIVLVSDGGDNCSPPDPCRVAEQIVEAGSGVDIQTIGFQVAGRAQEQLRCIAARARGIYRAADSSDELAVALRALSARAMRSFRPEGRAITGGAAERSATRIGTGSFVDAIRPGEERWYSLLLDRGQRLAATAVVVSPCPVDHDFGDMISTAIGLDVFAPETRYPVQRTGDANLFFGDASAEGAGLLTPAIGSGLGASRGFGRPGLYRLRFELSDNGGRGLRQAFGSTALPLQIETRLVGGEPRTGRGAPSSAPVAQVDADDGRLAPIIAATSLLGVLFGLLATALRRGRA